MAISEIFEDAISKISQYQEQEPIVMHSYTETSVDASEIDGRIRELFAKFSAPGFADLFIDLVNKLGFDGAQENSDSSLVCYLLAMLSKSHTLLASFNQNSQALLIGLEDYEQEKSAYVTNGANLRK